MTGPRLLALDCGTQSVRALLVDSGGEVVAKAQQPLDDYRSPRDGWHEHDADSLWQAAAQVCRRVVAEAGPAAAAPVAMAVTTQRGTLVPVDAAGRALRPFITWLDRRRASRVPALAPWWRAAFAAARVGATVDHFMHEAEVNWLAENEPECLRRTRCVLLVSGWLNLRLTGRFADSVASQVAYLPFDFRRQAWARDWDWKWQALALARAQLPELVPVGAVIGPLTREAAVATGLPPGLPVVAAGADKACEIAGAGALDPAVAALSYGTTATVAVTTARYLEPLPFVPPYPALWPDRYNAELQVFRGYWLVNWFSQQFGQPELAEAAQRGCRPEALLDRLLELAPAGAGGLMLHPYWTPGIRQPGLEARGSLVGFSHRHGRAHVYRAIVEGVAHALRDGLRHIVGRGAPAVQSLRVSGGGAQSDAALQITADLFGLPAARAHTFETAGVGAAMAAAVGAGVHADLGAASLAMTRVGRWFEPDPARQALYDELHAVWRRVYPALAPTYRRLQRVRLPET